MRRSFGDFQLKENKERRDGVQRAAEKSYFYTRSTSTSHFDRIPVFPFGMISPRCFSFHGVITICPVCGQRVFR